jgi:hypothetical protein
MGAGTRTAFLMNNTTNILLVGEPDELLRQGLIGLSSPAFWDARAIRSTPLVLRGGEEK